MSDIWFVAVECFNNQDGDSWQKYLSWSGLNQVNRLISLDNILCPDILKELIDEDWNHNVQENFLTFFFRDLDYLCGRTEKLGRHNILAAALNPAIEQAGALQDSHFSFCGYDLVEVEGGVSALVNCGGFPKSFDNSELNSNGLIEKLERARVVQDSLRSEYPDEHHADCNVWALWLMEPAV